MSSPEDVNNRDGNVMFMDFQGFDLNNCIRNYGMNKSRNGNQKIIGKDQRKIDAGHKIIGSLVAEQFANRKNVEIISETKKIVDDAKLRRSEVGLSNYSDSKIENSRILTILALQDCGERM